jgi:hypothetical protein
MGLNTVALIRNDYAGNIRDNQNMGEDLVGTMNRYERSTNPDYYSRMNNTTRVGNIEIVSMSHADNYQVVVVNRNAGYNLNDQNVPDDVLNAVIQQLEYRGYKVSKTKKVK